MSARTDVARVLGRLAAGPHDAWYAAIGRAFESGAGGVVGICSACGEERTDILKKNRLICSRCASMSAKKPKREGGTAGPHTNQAVLIGVDRAIYAGPLETPPGTPEGTEFIATHGLQFLVDVLLDPPVEPPFFLLSLSKNSDPVLGNTRLTYSMARVHIGGDVAVVVDQRRVQRWATTLLRTAAPWKALEVCTDMQRTLSRGPLGGFEAWEAALQRREELFAEVPELAPLLGEDGAWECRPGDHEWHWIGAAISARTAPQKERQEP